MDCWTILCGHRGWASHKQYGIHGCSSVWGQMHSFGAHQSLVIAFIWIYNLAFCIPVVHVRINCRPAQSLLPEEEGFLFSFQAHIWRIRITLLSICEYWPCPTINLSQLASPTILKAIKTWVLPAGSGASGAILRGLFFLFGKSFAVLYI